MTQGCVWLFLFVAQVWLSRHWIAKLNEWRVVQVQKSYGLQSHVLTKSSTPSMGGVVFIVIVLAFVIPYALVSGTGLADLALFWLLPLGGACIGFADDWIKFTNKSSEGFPSLYKLAAQVFVALPWTYWVVSMKGLYLWPGCEVPALAAIPLLTIISIGMLNAVNVTDGLDGLAAGASLLSFTAALVWLPLVGVAELPAIAGSALCAGFLWHNAHPAKVFMGDSGSHFLAGMLTSICVLGGYSITIVPLGFLFGLEILSVAVQLVAIHRFKRKVFKMSPVHHHFELSGWSETQIVVRFWIAHGIGLVMTALLIENVFFSRAV